MIINLELYGLRPGDELDPSTLSDICDELIDLIDTELPGNLNNDPGNLPEIDLHIDLYVDQSAPNSPRIKKKVPMREKLAHLSKYRRVSPDDEVLNQICSICHDHFKPKEYKRQLDNCKHTFHKRCIDNYFCSYSSKMECPLCRLSYAKEP